MTDEEFTDRVLRWRGVDVPCDKCGGAGVYSYGSTATWRGGIGGRMVTSDVCDRCWGSGDRDRHGADLRAMDGEVRTRLLRWRGVDDPCLKCDGSGVRGYSNGSTWRGGAGAASITEDVCDTCWGTGDRFRTGVDLRRLRDEESARIAKAATTAVSDSVGAYSGHQRAPGHLGEVLIELDKLIDRRRSPMSIWAQSALLGMRNLIAKALGVNERKL